MSRTATARRAAATREQRAQAAAPSHLRRRTPRRALLAGTLALAAVSGIGALALGRVAGGSDGAAAISGGQKGAASAAPAAPNLEADTVLFDREEIDLGRVPLDKAVPVTARLTNHSRREVILAQATAQTLEGC